MAGDQNLLVTAHSENYIHYWNLNNVTNNDFTPIGILMSTLKYPTTAIACFPKGNGFAIGSIEGRCGIKYVDVNNTGINPATNEK